jgi:hypothetical protein
MFWMLYSFFWAISRRLKCICRQFGTRTSFFMGGVRRKKEQTQCSDTSENKIQTLRNHLKKEYETVFVVACVCSSYVEQ